LKIDYIYPPFIFTDNGKRILIKDLKGTPRIGAELSEDLEVIGTIDNGECINGVCPIR
jgi:hypothetical protein